MTYTKAILITVGISLSMALFIFLIQQMGVGL